MCTEKVRKQIGKRGTILLAVAWVYGWLGYGLIRGGRGLPLPAERWASSATWGHIWIIVAFICIAAAISARDDIGYAAAVGLAAAWAGFYGASWLLIGHTTASATATHIWAAFAVILAISAWRRE